MVTVGYHTPGEQHIQRFEHKTAGGAEMVRRHVAYPPGQATLNRACEAHVGSDVCCGRPCMARPQTNTTLLYQIGPYRGPPVR